METISDRVKQILAENRERGLTQVQWAERAKVPRSSLASVVSGQSADPGCSTVEAMARAVGVNFLWLATGRGPRDAGAARIDPVADKIALNAAQLSPRMQRLLLAIAAKLAAKDEVVTQEFATRAAILGDKIDDVTVGDLAAFLTYLAASVAELPSSVKL